MQVNLLIKLSTFISLIFLSQAQAEGVIMPDPVIHQKFLIAPYDASKPSVVAFKDPFCGYCIKALTQVDHLHDYNVYLFWAPILGKRSESKVTSFFSCEKPVSDQVISSVIMRTPVNCSDKLKGELMQRNNDMVAAYQPSYVPQYWYSGRVTSISRLTKNTFSNEKLADFIAQSGVKIPWSRYSRYSVNSIKSQRASIALVLSEQHYLDEKLLEIISRDEQFNWYLFDNKSSDKTRYQEFIMLNGLSHFDHLTTILEGKVMEKQDIANLLPEPIAAQINAVQINTGRLNRASTTLE